MQLRALCGVDIELPGSGMFHLSILASNLDDNDILVKS